MELWPHQTSAIREIGDLRRRSARRILLACPTGGGKTTIMENLLELGESAILYVNRKALLEQMADRLTAAGFVFGVRASGHKPALLEKIQLSSIPTEESRVYRSKKWELHGAKLVLVDEAHIQRADVACKVLADHVDRGATVVGFTATPLDLGHLYDELIVAGTTSELRACGALVPAVTYAPDEPAPLAREDKVDAAELTEKEIRAAMPPKHLFGRVLEHWKKLNPDARPTILFAPGVPESLFFAEQFFAAGIPAAHIDGEEVWINGKFYDPSPEVRTLLREHAQSGRVKVVCNRFVLREGIDWPWLYHGIFATAFGSLSSYLQSGGRLLRAHKSLDHVIVQDHGGNWWRHGSLNSDREWELEGVARIVQAMRARGLREKHEPEPIVCPRCSAVRLWGRECERCGHHSHGRSRRVIESDGSLREVRGDIFKPRRIAKFAAAEQEWRSVYHRAKKCGFTFAQAQALFAKENKWQWPDPSFSLMPMSDRDLFRKVRDVPPADLRGNSHERQTQERRGDRHAHETGSDSLFGSSLFG